MSRGPGTSSRGDLGWVANRVWAYEAVVSLPTVKRPVLQHDLRSPSALAADFLVDTLRLIGISTPSAGHDATSLTQNFGGCFMPAQPASQPSPADKPGGLGPAAETTSPYLACR